MSAQVISGVRPWGRELADVEIAAGRISAIRPAGEGRAAGEIVDGRGRILLPSFSDAHVHLDSSRIGLPFRPHTGEPGVWNMMLNDRRNWRDAERDIAWRTTETLGRMIARGTTSVRTYAQVDVDCGLEKLDGVLAAKEAHAGRADVQIMAFPQAGLLRESGSAEILARAMESGADVVGGIDPCALDRDPATHLDIVFGLAERFDAPIDIHLHEPGELAKFSAELILERIEALDLRGRVTISHGYGLGTLPDAQLRALLERFREWDVAVATVAPPSPLSALLLAEHGIRLGLGEDGQRDYWSPYGDCDMLERTWQLAFTNGFRRDVHIEHAAAIATMGGRSVIGSAPALDGVADRPGLAVGDPADLVLVPGDTVAAAVMDRGRDRTVLHRGVVVADQLELAAAAS
ncbi:amidohydrolase family protein [Microbacterium karelineae]|uniref:amidohydrolase family protein n=1 Tax=Microbacterium karelineae TaxID=2654283 RepID=UPI0012EB01E4|nr:amidohydrolase family protein [Microbacterium karelineae]